MKRNNISGIYLMEKFANEEKAYPTCFEECSTETQEKFMDSLDVEGLKRLVRLLAQSINDCSSIIYNLELGNL